MASIRVRGNKLYIQYYDPMKGKQVSKATGYDNTPENYKYVEKIAKKTQLGLDLSKEKGKRVIGKSKTLQEAFDHFLSNNQYKSPKTIWEYNWFFKEFSNYFNPSAECSIITKIEVEKWLNKIKGYDYSKNTIHTLGKQCRHFLNFLFEYDYCALFAINREVMTKPELVKKIVLNKDDIKLIFDSVDAENQNLKVLIFLLFYTGLRPSDIYKMKIEDINLTERSLKYYSQKRSNHREVAFHNDLVKVLETAIGDKKSGQLLPWKEHNYLSKAVTRFFKRLGFDVKGYSARTFRKTFITLAKTQYKMDPAIVRELVGHEHQNTTDRHYNEVSLESMKKELRKFKRPV